MYDAANVVNRFRNQNDDTSRANRVRRVRAEKWLCSSDEDCHTAAETDSGWRKHRTVQLADSSNTVTITTDQSIN